MTGEQLNKVFNVAFALRHALENSNNSADRAQAAIDEGKDAHRWLEYAERDVAMYNSAIKDLFSIVGMDVPNM